jgi:exodeoxyribonuclease VII large subunit
MLFPALLQGENAINSILGQMDRIRMVKHHFDAVAIIRGGGGDVGLTCYNSYELAKAIALFPLPVITGIGHATNETVAEMVAFKNAITPTELADYLVQKFHNFSVPLANALEIIIDKYARLMQEENSRVMNTVRYFKSVTLSRLSRSRNEIRQELKALQQQSAYFIRRRTERDIHQNLVLLEKGSEQIFKFNRNAVETAMLNLVHKTMNSIQVRSKDVQGVAKTIDHLNPVNVLKRGYTITLADGKALKTVQGVSAGTLLKTILEDGTIISTTKSVIKTEHND